MKPVILFRLPEFTHEGEEEFNYLINSKLFDISVYRSLIDECSTVIARFSCLPFYLELEEELSLNGSNLINSYRQHSYISNASYAFDEDLLDKQPRSWYDRDISSTTYDGPFVVKGCTNSKKQNWDEFMFAKDKRQALEIASKLKQDLLLGSQQIIFREYIPFEPIGPKLVGGIQPINEYRFFCYKNKLLSCDFYWEDQIDVNYEDKLDYIGATNFAQQLADIVCTKTNFYTLDVAKLTCGTWMLVEINDGQMSGCNNYKLMWENLNKELSNGT